MKLVLGSTLYSADSIRMFRRGGSNTQHIFFTIVMFNSSVVAGSNTQHIFFTMNPSPFFFCSRWILSWVLFSLFVVFCWEAVYCIQLLYRATRDWKNLTDRGSLYSTSSRSGRSVWLRLVMASCRSLATTRWRHPPIGRVVGFATWTPCPREPGPS